MKSSRLPILSFQEKKKNQNTDNRQYKSTNEIRGNNTDSQEGLNFSTEKQKDVFAGTKLGTNVS